MLCLVIPVEVVCNSLPNRGEQPVPCHNHIRSAGTRPLIVDVCLKVFCAFQHPSMHVAYMCMEFHHRSDELYSN